MSSDTYQGSENPRIREAIADLEKLVRQSYPDATFEISEGDDPSGTYVWATVDTTDNDKVMDLVVDRLLELQVDQKLPIYFVPVRPFERIAEELKQPNRSVSVSSSRAGVFKTGNPPVKRPESHNFSDLTIRDENNRPLALVEIEGDVASRPDYAAILRSNVLSHTSALDIPFFLVLTPSVGYLWKSNPPLDAANSLVRLPDAEFSTAEILQHYVPGPVSETGWLGSALELVFYQWLFDLANGSNGVAPTKPRELTDTGFLQSMRGAHVILEDEFDRVR